MDRGRRSLGIRVVWDVRRAGYSAVLVVVRNMVIVLMIGIHVVVVVHGVDVLLVVILVMMGWVLRWRSASSTTSSLAGYGSHIASCYNCTAAVAAADTSWHGLPSRQMITVHLAGLGVMKQWLSTASATNNCRQYTNCNSLPAQNDDASLNSW